jgi:hypothetical protein
LTPGVLHSVPASFKARTNSEGVASPDGLQPIV